MTGSMVAGIGRSVANLHQYRRRSSATCDPPAAVAEQRDDNHGTGAFCNHPHVEASCHCGSVFDHISNFLLNFLA
jgi:hypothetical protein